MIRYRVALFVVRCIEASRFRESYTQIVGHYRTATHCLLGIPVISRFCGPGWRVANPLGEELVWGGAPFLLGRIGASSWFASRSDIQGASQGIHAARYADSENPRPLLERHKACGTPHLLRAIVPVGISEAVLSWRAGPSTGKIEAIQCAARL